jgi:hypothetical protein
MFARNMSIDPPRWGQTFRVVPTGSTPIKVAENLAKCVDDLIADNKVTGAGLVMPMLATLEETVKVMLALGVLPKWSVIPGKLNNEVVGELVSLRIARRIPFGNGECDSESLVLGNFPEFPPTRRSPLTVMEIYVGEPLQSDPKSGKPTEKANLAHMIARDKYPGNFDSVWQKSMEGREASLGRKDDNRAKAKVTLVMPVPMAKKLGCAP